MRLKVRRKGYLILPKSLRDLLGIEEGDELAVEIRDSIVLKPVRKKVDLNELRRRFADHVSMLKKVEGRSEPRPGELRGVYLEEEFD
jgi:AbrB family looped-hinge helix DNA binding protein